MRDKDTNKPEISYHIWFYGELSYDICVRLLLAALHPTQQAALINVLNLSTLTIIQYTFIHNIIYFVYYMFVYNVYTIKHCIIGSTLVRVMSAI